MPSATVLVVLANNRNADGIVTALIRRGYTVSAAASGGMLLEESHVSVILGLDIARYGDNKGGTMPEGFDTIEDDDPTTDDDIAFADEVVAVIKMVSYEMGVTPLGFMSRDDEDGLRWSVCRPKQVQSSFFDRLGRND